MPLAFLERARQFASPFLGGGNFAIGPGTGIVQTASFLLQNCKSTLCVLLQLALARQILFRLADPLP